MARVTQEQRREARRKRMRQGQQARQGGKIIPDCIDLSRIDGKVKLYEMKKRDNEIDILPFIVQEEWYPNLRDLKPYEIGPKIGIKPGEDDYKLQYAFHRGLGAEKKDYLCLRHMFGEPCPACEELDPIWEKKKDDRTKEDLTKADALKHKWRCLYNIYDYDEKDEDIIPLWDISYYLFEDFLQDKIEGDDDGIVDFSDIEEGKTITFDGKEGKFSTKDNPYFEADGIRFKDREPYGEEVYDDTISLDTLLVISTYDEIARALLHMDSEEDTQEEETTTRRRGRDTDTQSSERGKRGLGRRRGGQKQEEPEEQPPAEEEDIAPWTEGTCPEGLEFGADCNSDDKCQNCPQECFDVCSEYFDTLERQKKEEKEKQSGGSGRRRSGGNQTRSRKRR